MYLSDDEVELENDSEMENEPIQVQITSKKGKKTNQKPDQSSEFHFDFDDGEVSSTELRSFRDIYSMTLSIFYDFSALGCPVFSLHPACMSRSDQLSQMTK